MLLVEDYRVRISTQDERWRFRLLSTRSSNLKRRDIYMMGRKEKRVRGTDQPWQAFTAGQLQGLSSNPDRPFGVESVTLPPPCGLLGLSALRLLLLYHVFLKSIRILYH